MKRYFAHSRVLSPATPDQGEAARVLSANSPSRAGHPRLRTRCPALRGGPVRGHPRVQLGAVFLALLLFAAASPLRAQGALTAEAALDSARTAASADRHAEAIRWY